MALTEISAKKQAGNPVRPASPGRFAADNPANLLWAGGKAAEGRRSPRRWRVDGRARIARSVLECASPLALCGARPATGTKTNIDRAAKTEKIKTIRQQDKPMNTWAGKHLGWLSLAVFLSLNVTAATYYVNVSNTAPVSPFTDWATAATNIQDAVDVSSDGDLVLVTNGIYCTGGRAVIGSLTNRLVVDKAVTVQSVNGPDTTFIVGQTFPLVTGIRCAYLTNGASLYGFTLTNGGTLTGEGAVQDQNGGGAFCESSTAVISNCILSGNAAWAYGGGAFRGTLFDCWLTNNVGNLGGGAASNVMVACVLTANWVKSYNAPTPYGGGAYGASLSNCLLVGNQTITNTLGLGGGAAYCNLDDCTISNNISRSGGGLAYCYAKNSLVSSNFTFSGPGGGGYWTVFDRCALANNFASSWGGGACYGLLTNCVINNNYATSSGGGIFKNIAVNCTITGNSTFLGGPSGYGGGAFDVYLQNCIVYNNSAFVGSNYYFFQTNEAAYYCCTMPLPVSGPGNLTNTPLFVSTSNFHLQPNSPCINAGNNAYVSGNVDLAGHPRIVGGAVDIGAYEYQSPSSILSYAWAQQYGLPTDGTADTADSDGDQVSNYAEWKSGTVPTNSASVLKMASATNNLSGMVVTWQSVSGISYYLERSSDLAGGFSGIASNLVGQAGSTSYTDTTATNAGPYFYRVVVQ